jgi:hypothetical protein
MFAQAGGGATNVLAKRMSQNNVVMPGLGPGIHVFVTASKKIVDGRA